MSAETRFVAADGRVIASGLTDSGRVINRQVGAIHPPHTYKGKFADRDSWLLAIAGETSEHETRADAVAAATWELSS